MEKINVRYVQNRGFIFNKQDYIKIRADHRILGNLVGCDPEYPRDPTRKGLPAIYTSVELQLLYDLGIVSIQSADELPQRKPEHIELYKKYCENSREEQIKDSLKGKLEQSKQMIDKIIEGKRKKLIKAGKVEEANNLNETSVLEQIRNSHQFNEKNLRVQIPLQHSFEIETTLINLPENNSLKYRVFKDLWSKGEYVITEGDTFGCDFLMYPGDPISWHASHIVHVLETTEISAKQLISFGRLSIVVRKICIFAYANENNELCYKTLSWEGNMR